MVGSRHHPPATKGPVPTDPERSRSRTIARQRASARTTGVGVAPQDGSHSGPSEKTRLSFLAPSESDNSIGRLNHYEVLSVIGRGGFGIVLRAFDDKLRGQGAIKVLTDQAAGNPTSRERFLREARSAAAVRNPHVVQVFEVGETPLPYLVMEYVNGQTLHDVVKLNGPLEWEQNQPEAALQSYANALKDINRSPLDGLTTRLARRAMTRFEGLGTKEAEVRLRTWADAYELTRLTMALGGDPERKAAAYESRATWFACRGRWQESAEDHLMRVRLNPNNLHGWLSAGATTLLADDIAGYRQLRSRMAQLIEKPIWLWDTEVVSKIWLLYPEDLDPVKGSLQMMQNAVRNNEGDDWLKPWLAATQTLSSYRAGDFVEAVNYSDKVCKPTDELPTSHTDRRGALFAAALVVRAMAEQRRMRTTEAELCYQAALRLIPGELRTLGSSNHQGSFPVSAEIVDRDWLIAELLRREAERLLTATPQNNSE